MTNPADRTDRSLRGFVQASVDDFGPWVAPMAVVIGALMLTVIMPLHWLGLAVCWVLGVERRAGNDESR